MNNAGRNEELKSSRESVQAIHQIRLRRRQVRRRVDRPIPVRRQDRQRTESPEPIRQVRLGREGHRTDHVGAVDWTSRTPEFVGSV